MMKIRRMTLVEGRENFLAGMVAVGFKLREGRRTDCFYSVSRLRVAREEGECQEKGVGRERDKEVVESGGGCFQG
jgi:hypothetical protein